MKIKLYIIIIIGISLYLFINYLTTYYNAFEVSRSDGNARLFLEIFHILHFICIRIYLSYQMLNEQNSTDCNLSFSRKQ